MHRASQLEFSILWKSEITAQTKKVNMSPPKNQNFCTHVWPFCWHCYSNVSATAVVEDWLAADADLRPHDRHRWKRRVLPRVGCAVFATFFYSLRSEFKRIWVLFASYSHVSVYSQTWFIRFIFASKYSHKFAYKYSIWCKSNTFYHTGEYSLQDIRFKANIRKSLSEFHIQANICLKILAYKRIFACKYSHTSDFLLHIASNYKGKPFTILNLNE
jgi:hypothetical protein